MVQFGLCDSIDTLAQRFGRGGRGPDVPTLCILLVPPKLFTNVQEKKQRAAAERQKKRVIEKATGFGTVHQVAVLATQNLAVGVVQSDDEEESEDEAVMEPAAVSVTCQPGASKKRKRADALSKLSPEMDAFINADHLPATDERRHCRRKVLKVHYGNNRIRKSHAIVITEQPI